MNKYWNVLEHYSGLAFLGLLTSGRGVAKSPLLPKICHTYPTMIQFGTVIPYIGKSQKYIYINNVTHPRSSADIKFFLTEFSKFCYIKKCRYRLHFDTQFLILLTFIEFLKIVLTNITTILMMPAKMATPGLLKIKVIILK